MKAVFKGYISFGLVSIPVKLYSAVEPRAVQFRFLHKKDNYPLHYKRWCDKCRQEVKWGDVVRGIEYAKTKFFPVSQETLEKLKPEKSDYIDIVEFVDANAIDPIYFDRHYFAAPEKEKEKAYFLFKEVLEATAKTAVGRMVMREKEHVVAIESYKKGLILTTLNYAYEIRDINKIEELKTPPQLTAEQLNLAKELINKLYEEEFDITKFKDTFAEQIKPLIRKMLKGEKVTVKKPRKLPKKTLMQQLKASIK
jgi:DNA end-binding protein Ku